jgi:hypothetical protein
LQIRASVGDLLHLVIMAKIAFYFNFFLLQNAMKKQSRKDIIDVDNNDLVSITV